LLQCFCFVFNQFYFVLQLTLLSHRYTCIVSIVAPVPKLQLGNREAEALASWDGKLRLHGQIFCSMQNLHLPHPCGLCRR